MQEGTTVGTVERALKRKSFILALVMFALFGSCYGTTAIFVVTPDGIAGGTDQLTTEISTADGAAKSKATNIPKVELIHKRFVVATVSFVRTPADGSAYSFSDWIKAVGDKLTADASVTQFVRLIEDEATRTFKDKLQVEAAMQDGRLKKSQPFEEKFVEYIVGGYEAGKPAIVSIELRLDWHHNLLIGPLEENLSPLPGVTFHLIAHGEDCAFSEVNNVNSYSYKKFHLYRPATLAKIVAWRELTKDEAIDAIRVLIKIQAEITPSKVGKSTRIVWLPVRGLGSADDYAEIPVPGQNLIW
jgi:hypothetical protein